MKTNELMIRKMGNLDVIQRTQDSFFNATILLKEWNNSMNTKKEVKDYFDLKVTKQFMEEIYNREYKNTERENYPLREIKGTVYKVQHG